MSIWKFPEAEAVKGGWRTEGSPDSFSTRDRHAPHPVLRPIMNAEPHKDGGTVGIAGWLEEFQLSQFDTPTTCEGTVKCSGGQFWVNVNGAGLVAVNCSTPDLFHALDIFCNAIRNARSVARDNKQAMGIFEGKEETYYEPVSPAFFAELTERGAKKMSKDIHEEWRKENYPNWGSW